MAAGDRPCLRGKGLREGAGRGARRRSRRAGRCFLADALEHGHRRCERPGLACRAPSRCRATSKPRPQLARRLAQIGLVDRETGARLAGLAEGRPAAGVARRRPVALGRLCRRGSRPDRRGAAAGATQPLCRNRRRTGDGPRRSRRSAPRAGSGAIGLQRRQHLGNRNPHARARPQPPGGAAIGACRKRARA